GEVRDRDTADMAVQAALTGHLVISTLHTNDAPTAVTRLLDLGVPAYLLNSTLLGVMAQRLVRTLCPHCKKPGEAPDDETWRSITSPWRGDKPGEVMLPEGCLECRMTGYYGRIGLYEIMLMTPALRRLVTHEADDRAIREAAFKDGMKPLRVSGATKVASGITTADEVMKVAPLA
ncbi:MAG: Flp pilus assembly complex ATPase component TadA, partial [Betaproteobacteria bacterium]|nr:Flp pilus assembly complex ATPase component TadA [Betaproteobacteria bacterium]